jgi:hypothetical protein
MVVLTAPSVYVTDHGPVPVRLREITAVLPSQIVVDPVRVPVGVGLMVTITVSAG